MSSKSYNRPMSEEERKQFVKTGAILIISSLVFMATLTALVHFDVIRLYPTSLNAESLTSYAKRLEFTFRYQTLLAVWLLFNIFATIYGRVTTKAINPLDESTEHNVQRYKLILTNSFEQIFLSVLAQLIFISFAAPQCVLKVIPLVNIIQFVGRIAFFYGYPYKRGFGFNSSFVPTILLIIYNVYAYVKFLFE